MKRKVISRERKGERENEGLLKNEADCLRLIDTPSPNFELWFLFIYLFILIWKNIWNVDILNFNCNFRNLAYKN